MYLAQDGNNTFPYPDVKYYNKVTKAYYFAVGIWKRNSDSEDPNHEYDMVIEKKSENGLGKRAVIETNQTYHYDKNEGFTDINEDNKEVNACIKAYYRE